MSDVDYFKRYNDTYGHGAGDRCLVAVADAFKHTFRRVTDFAARCGGEEFAAILSGSDAQAALARAEVLHLHLHDLAIEHAALGAGRCLTLSIGVATCEPDLPALEARRVVEAADRALYRAKAGGRDRIEVEPVNAPATGRARALRQAGKR
jgi:diguanylate cyclase (GGDEF)-like protein